MKQQSALKWVWSRLKKRIPSVIFLSVVSALISGSYVAFAMLSGKVINAAVNQNRDGNLWIHGSLLFGVLLSQAALNIISSRLNVFVSGKLSIDIQRGVFSGLYRKRWQSVSEYHSGDVLNRLTNDISVTVTGMTTLIPRVVSLVTRVTASVAVLLYLDRGFTFVMLGAGAALLVFSRMYGKRMKKLHKNVQEADGKNRSYMQECVENWMAVQSFGGARAVAGRLKSLQEHHFRLKLRRNTIGNMANTAIYLMFSGCYYAALVWGAIRMGTGVIDVGEFTSFLGIVNQIQGPFRGMSGVAPEFYNMLASAERLIELENLPTEESGEACPGLYESMTEIRAKNLSFSYGSEPVFREAELSVKKGEFVALAGSSGIGKSTLLKLLLGFLTPEEGGVYLCRDGKQPVPADSATRGLFAYVPQGNMILSGTIRQNITFFNPDLSDSDLWAAAETADMAEFIRGLPDGMESELGERGLGLSEGQVQRLAIARAVLYGAPILLLDEATAALDEVTEARVLKNLRAIPGRTCLCVSHRPMTLAACDRVVHIKDGKFLMGSQQ